MKTKLHFKKMHGLGNDFMMIDGVNQKVELSSKQIQQLANRHTGIGFDQCLIVEPAKQPELDFYYRIFNADGNEVGQCGNGARCLALFISALKLSEKQQYSVSTKTSRLLLKPLSDSTAWVEFDEPQFAPEKIPLNHPCQADYYPFQVKDRTLYLHCVNVGNPHGILLVDDLSDKTIDTLGPQLSQHPKFNEGANISFVKVISANHLKLRVYERGSGETLACGSAAIASHACLRLFHNSNQSTTVSLPGGELNIHWPGLGHKINFSGPAVEVFDGVIQL